MDKIHKHRQVKRIKLKKAGPDVTYAPGFFTEPVRAWKQLQFESQIVVDPKTKRFASDFAMAAACRANSGFNGHPLNLPGAMAHAGSPLGF